MQSGAPSTIARILADGTPAASVESFPPSAGGRLT